jgi:hypothetical protein
MRTIQLYEWFFRVQSGLDDIDYSALFSILDNEKCCAYGAPTRELMKLLSTMQNSSRLLRELPAIQKTGDILPEGNQKGPISIKKCPFHFLGIESGEPRPGSCQYPI